jgi:uncharacterized protein YgfB (UPF0149 family)
MQKTNLFSYEQLEKALCSDKKDHLPSELHGYICGIICGSHNLKDQDRFKLILDKLKEENLSAENYQKIFAELTIKSFKQLQDCCLQLVLPKDESSMKTRLKSLSKWCQGFLSGLGETGITQKDIDQKELHEALKDLFTITNVKSIVANAKTTNDDELHYIELVEHVRVSTLLIYTENFLGHSNI